MCARLLPAESVKSMIMRIIIAFENSGSPLLPCVVEIHKTHVHCIYMCMYIYKIHVHVYGKKYGGGGSRW